MPQYLIVADSNKHIAHYCGDASLLPQVKEGESLVQDVEQVLSSIVGHYGAESVIEDLNAALKGGTCNSVAVKLSEPDSSGYAVRLEVHFARVSQADSVTIVTLSKCHSSGLNIANNDSILQSLDHELLGPLTVIIGYSDSLLSMGSLGPFETESLQEIRAAGRKLTHSCRRFIKAALMETKALDLNN